MAPYALGGKIELHCHESREPTDTSKYSIEHIMPQNEKLLPEWKRMLGEGWRDVQREWLHRLGNLTLTGYNSTYSDRAFDEKKTIEGGFAESSVRLNKFVREQEDWIPRVMEQRGTELASRALVIWPKLVVDKVLIAAASEVDMRERAQRRDVSKVQMSPAARQLFALLRQKILSLDSDIIELAEQKSVSYHGPAFFLEVLPRKNRIGLLLAVAFNEVNDSSGMAEDTSQWKFFVNAVYEGGVYLLIHDEIEIEKAFSMIRLAREVARA